MGRERSTGQDWIECGNCSACRWWFGESLRKQRLDNLDFFSPAHDYGRLSTPLAERLTGPVHERSPLNRIRALPVPVSRIKKAPAKSCGGQSSVVASGRGFSTRRWCNRHHSWHFWIKPNLSPTFGRLLEWSAARTNSQELSGGLTHCVNQFGRDASHGGMERSCPQ